MKNYITEDLIQAVSSFLNSKGCFHGLGVDSLDQNYNWTLADTEALGFKLPEAKSNFELNILLKKELTTLWRKGGDLERKQIVKWIISDWGGIRGNKQITLDKYHKQAINLERPIGLKGIASFSKVLMALDYRKFAIYDARVAASLMAIQILDDVEYGAIFPYLSGRNNIVGNWSSKPRKGFTADKRYSPKALLKTHPKWFKVDKELTYETYLILLKEIQRREGVPVYKSEMALFANAELLVKKLT